MPRLHVGPGSDLAGGVAGRLYRGHASLELLPVTDVRDQCLEQLGVVGEVKIKRLPRDARRAGDRRHRGDDIALLLQKLAGGVQDPVPRA